LAGAISFADVQVVRRALGTERLSAQGRCVRTTRRSIGVEMVVGLHRATPGAGAYRQRAS
jgi:hypothetical protein